MKDIKKQKPQLPPKKDVDCLIEAFNKQQIDKAYALAESMTKKYPAYFFAWKALGIILKTAGRPLNALEAMRQAARLAPTDIDTQTIIGHLHKDLGQLNEAEIFYRKVITLAPASADAYYNLANVLAMSGQAVEAVESYKKAIHFKPRFLEAQHNLTSALLSLDRFAEAEESCRACLKINPEFADGYVNLGNIVKAQDRLSEAVESYRKALAINPQHASAHFNLGKTLEEQEQFWEAEASYREAVRLNPNHVKAFSNLASILVRLCRFKEAEACCRIAISIDPNMHEAYGNLGNALKAQGMFAEAAACYERIIKLAPQLPEAYSNLGLVLKYLGKLIASERFFKRAIGLKNDFAEAYNNLGLTLQELGRLEEATTTYRQAIQLEPSNMVFRDNLLFTVNYDETLDSASVYQEYEKYDLTLTKLRPRLFEHLPLNLWEQRRIRIGYSSPDFRGHACRYFMEPLFQSHDKGRFELYAYANVTDPDAHTERLRGYFDHWVDVSAMTDEHMAQRVFDDDIDILVDLAGHTAGNRLPVFAMRPAPIQVSSLMGAGYTTGLKEIDYIIGDEYMTPVGCEEFFSEKIWRIPAPQFCYTPPNEHIPAVNELPASTRGYVTFGSLSRTVRLNDHLLKVWGVILDRVPGSRLRLDQVPFSDEETREFFYSRLESLGLPRGRVDLTFSRPHWNAYHDIDITLDCFPHNAGTTTVESLWMGVPVLTKLDRPSVGRIGASALIPLGLENWVADTEAAYIEKAVAFASNITALVELRSTLRDRVSNSQFKDSSSLTKKLEGAFLQIINEQRKAS